MQSANAEPAALIPTVPPDALGSLLPVSGQSNMIATLGIRWSSLPLDTQAAEDLMLSSVGETSLDTDEMLSMTFSLTAWLVREQVWVDARTAEVRTGPTAYLVDDHGQTYRSSSRGIIEGLAVIAARRAPGIYDPPIPVVIKRLKTAAGLYRHIVTRGPVEVTPNPAKGVKNGNG